MIRANAGDCIEMRLTNLLPEYLEESPFQMRTRTDIVGYHIHLVKFDTIVSDSAANGWNNIAGAGKYETLIIPMQGAVSIGNTFQMELKNGACCPGDYLYRSGSLKWDVESGMWGIFRVLKQGIGCKCKNACRRIMNCVGRHDF